MKEKNAGRAIACIRQEALYYLAISTLFILLYLAFRRFFGMPGAVDSQEASLGAMLAACIASMAALLIFHKTKRLFSSRSEMKQSMSASAFRLLLLIRLLYFPALSALALYAYHQTIWLQRHEPLFLLILAIFIFVGELSISLLPPPIVFYIFFGALTTVVAQLSFNAINWLLFQDLAGGGGLWWTVAFSFSWLSAVLFAFVTNRAFVFTHGERQADFWAELGKFMLGRLGSGLLVESLGMLLLVNGMGMAESWAKLLTSFIVIIVNYVVSKLFVFRKMGKS